MIIIIDAKPNSVLLLLAECSLRGYFVLFLFFVLVHEIQIQYYDTDIMFISLLTFFKRRR